MIVGHDRFIEDLERLADTKTLAHAYLFWGVARVGKKTVSLALARYLEEKKPITTYDYENDRRMPLGDCLYIAPDPVKRSIGIDAARTVKNFLSMKPAKSDYRMVVIDDAELLTNEAQDALLKICENPPASGMIIMIGKTPELIKPTLLSRLQKVYFSTVKTDLIEVWLRNVCGVAEKRAREAAQKSFNQPGRAFALVYDKEFQAQEERIAKFLKMRESDRVAYIKESVKHDDFNLEDFLDTLIAYAIEKKEFSFWHELLELRRATHFFNVSPRIQLEYLSSFIGKSWQSPHAVSR